LRRSAACEAERGTTVAVVVATVGTAVRLPQVE
jgi:hypothetical protein